MDWITFFSSLFVSVGGAVGITKVILNFAKKRTEAYIDNAIQLGFDRKLEDYKQELKKQFSNYETFSKKYNDCIENVIKQLSETEKHLKVTQEGIKKCLGEGKTLDYIFNQHDNLNSITKLSNIIEELTQIRVLCHTCLPDQLTDEIEDVLDIINKYVTGIKQEMGKVLIDRITCERLLDSGKTIHKKVESFSKHIREKGLQQSGEL